MLIIDMYIIMNNNIVLTNINLVVLYSKICIYIVLNNMYI